MEKVLPNFSDRAALPALVGSWASLPQASRTNMSKGRQRKDFEQAQEIISQRAEEALPKMLETLSPRMRVMFRVKRR